MKKSLTFMLVLMIIAPVMAQQTFSHSHQLTIGGGHEWNAFLMPNTLIQDEDPLFREDLWDNGSFQSFSMDNSLRWEKDQHKFKLKLDGSLGIFQTEENSNRHTYTIGTSYRVKYASKKYFEFAPEYFRKKRQGINGDQAVLATPFSFQQFRAPVSFDFYLGDGAWIKSEVGYLIKSYDRPSQEVLRYQAPFLGLSMSKKWTLGTHTTKLTLRSLSQWRKYTQLDLIRTESNDEEEEDEFFEEEDDDDTPEFRSRERNWGYYFNNLTYSVKTDDKKVKAEVGLYSTIRSDARDISNYLEIGPGINGTVQFGKLEVSPSIRYSIRKYSRLAPGAGNNLLLRYHYIRTRINAHYQIGKDISLFGRYLLTHRTSNNPNLDRVSFREYFYALGEMGLKWNF